MNKTLTFLIVVLMTVLFIVPVRTSAGYNPGNLISDAEFINWRTLDANGVQQFLNIRGGTRLRTFSEGGLTAAQIIANAATANRINPLVILATIQKEESIVDSNYNFDYRVVWAMGYGVCDSCDINDPGVQKYRGFTNQINNGAWQLARNYSYWAVNGSAWHVGKTMVIDGTAVRFANRATSALYRYTPHLPGNQNFYTIYNQYKTFAYKWSSKTKVAVDKSALVANKLKLIAAKNKGNQSGQGEATYNTQYVTQVGRQAVAPGQRQTLYVYLKNTGTTTWQNNGSNPVYLGNSSPQDRSSLFTGGNVRWRMLQSSVAPGKVGVFSIQVTAPGQTGTYVERFRPVMEGVTWFGDEVTFTFNVGAAVSKSKIK